MNNPPIKSSPNIIHSLRCGLVEEVTGEDVLGALLAEQHVRIEMTRLLLKVTEPGITHSQETLRQVRQTSQELLDSLIKLPATEYAEVHHLNLDSKRSQLLTAVSQVLSERVSNNSTKEEVIKHIASITVVLSSLVLATEQELTIKQLLDFISSISTEEKEDILEQPVMKVLPLLINGANSPAPAVNKD